ncbi:MAG: hypothetical protein IJV06_00370 [Bacteroidaceae bacterium]|nr:hypothetical protein [Bacteroidaceae bacterium]
MKKVFYGAVFFGALLTCGCENTFKDVYGDVNENTKPEWLGGSIYSELQNPDGEKLTGSFSNYLKLIDDLGYAETLNRTGSKTIFPANDEAFARFFAKNDWGVSTYEELTFAQKKLLLYSSMLDNALLVRMLSNAYGGTKDGLPIITEDVAIKHPTNLSVIDTIEYIAPANMPKNNSCWDQWREGTKGIYAIRDNTVPMLVHFTREQMVKNGITTTGEGSDFEILTGEKYDAEAKNVYIFDNKVIHSDVTCQNGYIHQVQNVLVPPGNLAQVIAKQGNTKYFSHILDYYAMPYLDATNTKNYNDWVQQYQEDAAKYGYVQHDSVMQIRYLSSRSQNAPLVTDPNGSKKSTTEVLRYDPGWNQYYPADSYGEGGDQKQISDIAAMFVPTDEAFEKYFLKGGAGEYIINVYGKKPNTKENLLENLDTLFIARAQILTAFVRNLQQPSFTSTVPSKFETIVNDAGENLGMNMSKLQVAENGRYDIKIANNGVVYKLNEMIAPDEYSAVLAPSSTYQDMHTMDWAVQDWHSSSTTSYLSLDFKYFLLAMKANYAFFIPDDDAFDCYYLDPTTLGHDTPEMLHIYYDKEKRSEPKIQAESFAYDLATNTVGERLATVEVGSVATPNPRIKSALTDILNYHTVVLNHGDTIGITNMNHYYKTKHGGEIYVDYGTNPRNKIEVKSGAAIDNGLESAKTYDSSTGKASYFSQANGTAYRIDRIIQPTIISVSEMLRKSELPFQAFHEACAGFANAELLNWIGISDQEDDFHRTEQERYQIFTQNDGSYQSLDAVDGNVKMFNTYNYTLYAPNNEAMQKAYDAGLPSWDEIVEIFEKHSEQFPDSCPEPYATVLKNKVTVLKNFCRYHFQNTALYADNTVDGGTYQSLYTNNYGLAQEYKVAGGSGVITVTDASGTAHIINANDASKVCNKMTRDYWLNNDRRYASSIATSSFCVIHEVTEPFYYNKSKRYDAAWASNDPTQDAVWSAAKSRGIAKKTVVKRTR